MNKEAMSHHTPGSSVPFSWEHQPGISKQNPKPGPVQETQKIRVFQPESPKKPPAKGLLYVPPPPGAFHPSRRSTSRKEVRPSEDPFLAAYLECTKSVKKCVKEPKARKRLGWTALGLRLSCKTSSCGVREDGMVRLAKIPSIDPRND